MKTILFTLLVATMLAAQAQIKHIKPGQVYPMPPAPKTQVELDRLVEDDPIYSDLYGGRCSWYCGGVVDTVMASSQLHRIKRFTYEAAHAHDFDHESVWAEGAAGQGSSARPAAHKTARTAAASPAVMLRSALRRLVGRIFTGAPSHAA